MISLGILLLLIITYRIVIRNANRRLMDIPYYSAHGMSHASVTVVIAARNEEDHIIRCLQSVLLQKHGFENLEIIVVDDQSSDKTAEIVGSFQERGVRLIQIGSGEKVVGKKAAIARGISAASHDIIVTTDADCIFPTTWLNTIVSFKEKTDAVFVAAPVMFRKELNLLEKFQSLDFLSLQGITASAVHSNQFNMCNGANLLYTKEAFNKVNGFEGIDHIASGDDMLLMEKIGKAYPGSVQYCYSREAIVTTEPANSLKSFFQQRTRWASKAGSYSNVWIKLILLNVFLVNVGLVAVFVAGFFDPYYFKACGFFLLLKIIVELPFMIRIAWFFNKTKLIRWFIPSQPFHVLYTLIAASFGMVTTYTWKGRKLK
jgi:cellulose synthase/poly-beta-1,6-N-acetylglucosamine synthase-like glycosyltransferase